MKRSLVVLIVLLFALVVVSPSDAAPDDDPVQRAALMALYNSTDGPNWIHNGGWGSASHYCTWRGVDCMAAPINRDNIDQLNLPDNNLSGHIPAAIGDLIFLSVLNLSDNLLSGHIPSEIGIWHLLILNLANNQLTGSLPPGLGCPYNVLLNGNNLSGSIPADLGCTDLRNLNLSNNNLSGEIPGLLVNLDQSVYLDLSSNPSLECWQTTRGLQWAMNNVNYQGPLEFCGSLLPSLWLPFICSAS